MFEPISLEEFEGRTGLVPHSATRATKIVSLRNISPESITAVHVMRRNYLETLLRSVTLEGDENSKPYADCEIILARMDPHDLVVGQTFVQRSKYQDLLENFGDLLDSDFCVTRGTAKCNALMVFAKTDNGEEVVAHYVPPIIEATNGTQFLLDGIHRNFLVMRIGTTIESVLLKGVKSPLPCQIKNWSDIQVVDEKPPREQRFYDLQPHLFRDLKWIGVDG